MTEDMPERDKIERAEEMEIEKQTHPTVLRCIDFRTGKDTSAWLKDQGLEEGSYYLYASAGASGNPEGFIKTAQTNQPSSTIVVDHEDCGFYKKTGDDSTEMHQHNLEVLGNKLKYQHPEMEYKYHLLRVDDSRHNCTATAIILGEPELVKSARDKLKELGLENDHDEIARPFALSVNDETVWEDLNISLNLHHPTKILLFEKDADNAKKLIAKIKQVAEHIQAEHIVLEPAA